MQLSIVSCGGIGEHFSGWPRLIRITVSQSIESSMLVCKLMRLFEVGVSTLPHFILRAIPVLVTGTHRETTTEPFYRLPRMACPPTGSTTCRSARDPSRLPEQAEKWVPVTSTGMTSRERSDLATNDGPVLPLAAQDASSVAVLTCQPKRPRHGRARRGWQGR